MILKTSIPLLFDGAKCKPFFFTITAKKIVISHNKNVQNKLCCIVLLCYFILLFVTFSFLPSFLEAILLVQEMADV